MVPQQHLRELVAPQMTDQHSAISFRFLRDARYITSYCKKIEAYSARRQHESVAQRTIQNFVKQILRPNALQTSYEFQYTG
jgi:hypothetical protein